MRQIKTGYIVKIKPKNEMLAVQLHLSNLKGGTTLQIEGGSGGAPENHYADSIHNLEGCDADGNRLTVEQVQNRQWKVDTRHSASLKLEYQADLSRTHPNDHYHSIIADKYAYLLGNQIFIYPLDIEDADITVRIEAPQGWRTVASWQKQKDVYHPASFNKLADSMLASGDYRIYHFDVDSTKVTLAIRWAQGDYDEMIIELIERLLSANGQFFGMFPASKVTVICNQFGTGNEQGIGLGGSGAGDGVVLALTGRLSEDNLDGLYHLLSHELLHWWISGSVTDESTYWFSEGFTDYYTRLMKRRIGLISREQWYDKLYQVWQKVCENPKVRELSLREASLSYFDDRAARRLCYDKGMCLAFILDVKIRRYTKNRRSLDDVMRKMAQYMKEHGLTFYESEIFSAIDEAAGHSLKDFYQRYVYGTHAWPFKRYLKLAGMAIQEYTQSYLGYGFSFGTRGGAKIPIVILEVLKGSPARQAGLRRNDRLLEIEGASIPNMDAADAIILQKHGRRRMSESGKGDQIPYIVARSRNQSLTLTIQRGSRIRKLRLMADDVEEVKGKIEEFTNADKRGRDILSALIAKS